MQYGAVLNDLKDSKELGIVPVYQNEEGQISTSNPFCSVVSLTDLSPPLGAEF